MPHPFFTELKRRRVVRVGLVYGAVAFAVVEAADVFVPALALPSWILTAVAFLAVLGLPVALVLAWAYQIAPEGSLEGEGDRPGPGRGEALVSRAGQAEAVPEREPRWLNVRTVVVAGLVVAFGFALGIGWLPPALSAVGRAERDATPIRTSILPPPGSSFEARGGFALSSDGRRLAFALSRDLSPLWIREMDETDARSLPETEGAAFPFWSPDGAALGFFADGDLKVVSPGGEGVRTLVEDLGARGGAWNRQGVIIFAGRDGAIHRVPASGGEVERLTAAGGLGRQLPTFLPGGRRFLFSLDDANGVFVGDLDGGDPQQILSRAGNAVYAPPGWILYNTVAEEQTLFARRFDAESLEFLGPPFVLARNLQSPGGILAYSVSGAGYLAYARSPDFGRERSSLLVLDRQGAVQDSLATPPGTFGTPRFSNEGQAVVFGGWELWVRRLDRQVAQRIRTPSSYVKLGTVWDPGDSLIAYYTKPLRDSPLHEVRIARSDGSSTRRLIASDSLPILPTAWSPDGRVILGAARSRAGGTSSSLWTVDTRDGSVSLWRSGTGDLDDAVFSPDGNWVAYTEDEGDGPQVYATPFPGPGANIRVSSGGGGLPLWSSDGGQLYYVAAPDSRLMVVAVSFDGGEARFSDPRPVFPEALIPPQMAAVGVGAMALRVVSPDARRILVSRLALRVPPELLDFAIFVPLTLVQNWTAGLEDG